MISTTSSNRDQNIKATPYRVNAIGGLALVIYTLARSWLVSGVELGKDEAVYWYWSQHLDASYALLPFSLIALADALMPRGELFVRMPSILLGTLAVYWLYQLCRDSGLSLSRARWAAAAFALSHWAWHTSSYLHPDVYLTTCWLLALRRAMRFRATHSTRDALYMGAACGAAVLCKYSGAFLTAGLGLWLLYACPQKQRTNALSAFVIASLCVAAPLIHAQISTAFYLPQTLSTLSKIEPLTHSLARLLFFAVNPLLFVSPLLLYLLYRALLYALHRAKRAPNADLLLALLPTLCTLGAFLFFALSRGQIKGNWILVGFLSLWPLAFSLPVRRSLYIALIASGLVQALAIGLGLKYPGSVRRWVFASALDASYVGLVSQADRRREPSYSWSERLCEYSGWKAFSRDVEALVRERGIAADTPLVSNQYSIPFSMAYYAFTPRPYYTVDDPRFRDLTDLGRASAPQQSLLFAARGTLPPESALGGRLHHRHLGHIERSSNGCAPVRYDLYLLE